MKDDKCDNVINKLKISETDSKDCKEINTFILATTDLIKPVCGKAGEPYKGNANLRISTKTFHVINCKAKKEGKRLPNCMYGGKKATVRIVIACEGEFPVHYHTGVYM